MSDYLEKLKDPRWQKIRLKVFERDSWCCQQCFSDEKTLAVHHLYYLPDREPWDYELDALITLCQPCHDEETKTRRDAEQRLIFELRRVGAFAPALDHLSEALAKVYRGAMAGTLLSAAAITITNSQAFIVALEIGFRLSGQKSTPLSDFGVTILTADDFPPRPEPPKDDSA